MPTRTPQLESVAPLDWRSPIRRLAMVVEALTFASALRPRLRGRSQLPTLLNSRGLCGVGVEIGVCEGGFSEFLLSNWDGNKLISVDPWCHWTEEYVDKNNREQVEMNRRFEVTKQRLATFGKRSEIVRKTGADAAKLIPDESLDLVYIDAQHHEEAVSEDLCHWFPKIRRGGLMAGHDYLDGSIPSGEFGVKSAVDKFTLHRGIDVCITTSEDWPTWYFFKP